MSVPARLRQPPAVNPRLLTPDFPSHLGDENAATQSITSSSQTPGPGSPMLRAPASNNHSAFSFGGGPGPPHGPEDTAGSHDFLPSVNFDDLQSSLESASNDFRLNQFPSPTGLGHILDTQDIRAPTMVDKPLPTQNGTAPRTAIPPVATRPSRSASLLQSTSYRQPSTSSTVSPSISSNAPTIPALAKNRRQSHYPPVSGSMMTSNIGRPPRKSIGPGVIDGDLVHRPGQKRRPSLISNGGSGIDSTRTSLDGTSTTSLDVARSLVNPRIAKTRSIGQHLPRTSSASIATASIPSLDQTYPPTMVTPRAARTAGRGPAAPAAPSSAQSTNSQKRASIMPGALHTSHATGLGARTISPTDTRRMKRMSMHNPQSLTDIVDAPLPPVLQNREHSKSPSMIPRKASVTPSSSRTTPDVNRKSYSSGLSIGSSTSFNTVRTSTGSIQPRIPQSSSASRLPAPKSHVPHSQGSAAPNEDDEDVPPVPAIPKVYESPKELSLDVAFLDKRRANLTADASSTRSSSTGSFSVTPGPETVSRVKRKASTRKPTTTTTTLPVEKKAPSVQSKKSTASMHLPPITVGPLNPSTAAKVAALQEQNHRDRNLSPPPSRITAKTPSTPMTASKSSFFSRNRHDDREDLPPMRSSSTVHHGRVTSASNAAGSSSESLIVSNRMPSMSPFLSSSATKNGSDPATMRRPKTGDIAHLAESSIQQNQSKHVGSYVQKQPRSKAKSPVPVSDPEHPPTPSSMSSLRRKLSLSWKRGTSKTGSSAQLGPKDKMDALAKQDSMPPPRIPISATVGNLDSLTAPSPSSSLKSAGNSSYLESRRRKSSASSMNTYNHDRTKSENWAQQGNPPVKKVNVPTSSDRQPVPRNPSVMQKILRPKASTTTMRTHDPWMTDLDKDDLVAEEEMRKLGSRRKETEVAARTLDALKKRATPKERVGPHEAIRIAMLNIYERGEIVDYNDVFFCGTQNAKKVVGDLQSDAPNFGYDDERGDYTIVPGDHLSFRYEIIDILGKGSFGQVVRCIDHKLGVLVAIKIIRNKKRFHQQALVEVNILQKLREWDPKNKHSMVNFTHSFYFRGHLCISTELLDMNLYEFIKVNAFRGFSVRLIRRLAKQMLGSLNLLKQHKVIHCDLKPENILLRHPLHTEIKVIDFGSSCFEDEKVYTYIQSRFYRSPEVILGMTYGMPIDMWSLGCILAELYTGVPIFPGENEQEQLACIMEIFGPPEKHLIEKSTRKKLFFDSMGKPRLTVSTKGRRRRPSSKTLQQAIKCDDEAFLDFLARCLRWDPDRRLKPEDAIHHEFITGKKTTVSASRMPTRDASPVKRHNPSSAPRPLPEPPAVGFGAKSGPLARPREVSGISPYKPVSGTIRKTSGTTATIPLAAVKRTSTGTGGLSAGMSSLPRAAGRTVSGRQDLASAGAAVAMGRRA